MQIPAVQGRITQKRCMADLTWLRVGGDAEYFFQPADVDDLAGFMSKVSPDMTIFPMGVGSNLIVRDGGLDGVVVRLGRGFNSVEFEGEFVIAGAAALDSIVAKKAANMGRDLTFLRTIPGTIGGAVAMNAGCYGSYMADVFVSADAITREGQKVVLTQKDINFSYRQSDLPKGLILTHVTMRAPHGDADELTQRMVRQLAKRDETQPTKDRTAGSTFRNPSGFSSTGRRDDVHDLKAWKVIDDAGCRGLTLGGAQMSVKHPNFLINTGTASAADLEALGELVRKKVYENTGLTLEWEVLRIGKPVPSVE